MQCCIGPSGGPKAIGLAFSFVDMFGGKRREQDKGPSVYLDDFDFEQWMMLREERNRRKWRNEKARKRKKNETPR